MKVPVDTPKVPPTHFWLREEGLRPPSGTAEGPLALFRPIGRAFGPILAHRGGLLPSSGPPGGAQDTTGPPGWTLDHSRQTKRTARQLLDHQDVLWTTPGPPRRPTDHYRLTWRTFELLPTLHESLRTTLNPTGRPPTTTDLPGVHSDYSRHTGRDYGPHSTHWEGLQTTPGPLRGPPDHSWPTGKAY